MIVAAILALPLGFWLGLLVFPGPIVGVVIAALALGGAVLDGGLGDKDEGNETGVSPGDCQ